MKDHKIRCDCGCTNTLYICEIDKKAYVVGSHENGKKGFKNFTGVIIPKRKLYKLLIEDIVHFNF